MGLAVAGGFPSSNKMHTASSLREEEEELIRKVYRSQRGKMCLKAGKKKKYVLHVIYATKGKKMKGKGRVLCFVSCSLVFWFPSGRDA